MSAIKNIIKKCLKNLPNNIVFVGRSLEYMKQMLYWSECMSCT